MTPTADSASGQRSIADRMGIPPGTVVQELGYDDAQVSRVETGTCPPTESFAKSCDRVWPERNGWFLDYYTESREWLATPPWASSTGASGCR